VPALFERGAAPLLFGEAMRYLLLKQDNGEVYVALDSKYGIFPILNFPNPVVFRQWLLECLEWVSMDKNAEWFIRKAHEQSLLKDIPEPFRRAFDDKSP